MDFEEELRLSFYKEIASVNERHGVVLVQHADTGKVYVRKTLTHYDLPVFEMIRDGRFPGVPVIKELIESEGRLIVIEDYINGHSIDELLESGTIDPKKTAEIIIDLCDILTPFHSHTPQIVHRDIKASNVIVDNEGRVYLIDFDASKQVIRGRNRDTDLLGTEEYAAPEQYGFGQSDQRTDVYALGILMNKMLTGKFPSETKYDGSLSGVIERASAIDPKNRYRDVQSLKAVLENYCINGTVAEDADPASGKHSGGKLKKALSHLPYPVRELPGFRSGNPFFFCAALAGYALLIYLGFFGVAKLPEYTAAQNRFYDAATFLLFFVPVLYLGNYLGIRDRLPWAKSRNNKTEAVRIAIGAAVSVLIVIIAVSITAMILGM